jgi:3-oxoacyl-ACP reductase-like protein
MPATATKPGTVTKKPLSLAQAADQWEKAKRTIDRQKPLLEEAAEVLKEHFEKTGKTTYKDRIALVTGAARLVLDQAKVRVYLGKRLPEFQKRTEPSKSLTLLEPEK